MPFLLYQASETFGLKLPDLEEAISQEELSELRRLEKTYLKIEMDLAKVHFPLLMATAADSNRNNLPTSDLESDEASSYRMPHILSGPTKGVYSKHIQNGFDPIGHPLELPEDPRSFEEVLKSVSSLPSTERKEPNSGES